MIDYGMWTLVSPLEELGWEELPKLKEMLNTGDFLYDGIWFGNTFQERYRDFFSLLLKKLSFSSII